MKKTALIGIALLMAANMAAADGKNKEQTPAQKKMEQKLRETVIETCDFREANLSDIIDFLKSTSKDKDLNIVTGFPVTRSTPTITISLRKIPIGDVLRYVTEIAGLGYRIDDNAVVIIRKAATSYRTTAMISEASGLGQYLVDLKIYGIDAAGKEDVISAPKILVRTGQEGEIQCRTEETGDGFFAKVLVNEKNGVVEAAVRIVIRENGKETFNSAQTIALKKK